MSEELQQKIDEITQRYQPELDRITEEGERLGREAETPGAFEAVINVDFDMEWKEREITFDVPSLTMRERRLSLDLPKVQMDRQRIVFDTPSVRMENRVVGKYPVFRGLRVKWKDIITKVPVPFMERQEIIYDLPTVRMERKEISLKIPEFTMNRVRWSLKLPEFTVKSVKAEARQLQEKGQALQDRGQALADRMKQEVEALVAAFLTPLAEEGNELRNDVAESFTGAIQQVQTAINDLVALKIDPVKVPAEGGDINLRKTLTELIAERDRVATEMDAASSGAEDQPDEQREVELAHA